ncbi:MAG: hypothetical protein M3N39_03435 [Pseudomonadota bacterium]|nr:hypothetical protein [Pseudomonadota bacterium]
MINKLVAARISAFAAVGLSLASLAVPASAAEKETAKSASSGAVLSAASAVTARTSEKRYCLVEAFTGTRIPKKMCKTEREWTAEGVEMPRR